MYTYGICRESHPNAPPPQAQGVVTTFPHVSHVYMKLLSKRWQAELCTAPQFQIPPTVLVPISAIARGSITAAETALDTLKQLGADTPRHGVAKLGFSWEAMDVRVYTEGAPSLAAQLDALTKQEGFFGDCVLVQEYVDALCEVRLFVIGGWCVFVASCSRLPHGHFLPAVCLSLDDLCWLTIA